LYHDQAPSLINYYQSPDNENTYGGTEPVPDSVLINEAQNVQFTIIPGKTYLFRIVNMGAMTSQWLQFDQHKMTIVEVDGVYVQPYQTEQLFMSVAQRYSVLVTALPTASENFAIVSAMMTDMFDQSKYPADMDTTVTGWLVYDNTKPLPPPFTLVPQPFDDTAFFPLDNEPLIGPTGSLDNQ
jgi:iron transport multicopper oxidase